MDIKVFMTEKSNYIPNGTEIYTNVSDLEYDEEFGLDFMADYYRFPVSRKRYKFKPFELEKFQIGNFQEELSKSELAHK